MTEIYNLVTPCCVICDECGFYKGEKEPKCEGCLTTNGKPFWGECELFKCVTNHKNEHCGVCKNFPCDRLPDHFDPDNPRGKQDAIFRIGHLAIRAKIGTENWVKKRKDGTLVSFTEK